FDPRWEIVTAWETLLRCTASIKEDGAESGCLNSRPTPTIGGAGFNRSVAAAPAGPKELARPREPGRGNREREQPHPEKEASMKLLKLGMMSAVTAGAVMAMVMATTSAALAAARYGDAVVEQGSMTIIRDGGAIDFKAGSAVVPVNEKDLVRV